MTPNPYASPAERDSPPEVEARDLPLSVAQRKRLDVGGVVVAWEKRRVWYNLALAAVTLAAAPALLFARSLPDPIRMAEDLVSAVIAANACYLAGPIVEGYATWFFGPVPWLRPLLFVGGTLFAGLLAAAAVFVLAFATF